MARYIKANRKVAQYLRVENDRNTVRDGNYLLWQADILPFGKLTDLPSILEQIGGIALQAHEAREEQDGTNSRPLPIATDIRFVVEVTTAGIVEQPIVEDPDETPAEQPIVEDPDETTTENIEQTVVEEQPNNDEEV